MRGLLKERLFRKHYNSLLESRKNKKSKYTVNTVSSVTLLASSKHHTLDIIAKAPKYFRNMGMTCDVYIVRDKSDFIDVSAGVNLINTHECTWYDVPSQEILIKWLANKTDLLILSNPDRQPLLKYLCAASNSKLKSTLNYKHQQNDDIDIDLWIDIANPEKVNLEEQCKLTYSTLTRIGIKPPVIG